MESLCLCPLSSLTIFWIATVDIVEEDGFEDFELGLRLFFTEKSAKIFSKMLEQPWLWMIVKWV